MGLSLAIRGHVPQCQVLWGSALLPSGYSEDCAGKIEHLPFSLSFYFIALKLVSSQFSINKIFTTPKMDNIPKNVYIKYWCTMEKWETMIPLWGLCGKSLPMGEPWCGVWHQGSATGSAFLQAGAAQALLASAWSPHLQALLFSLLVGSG